MATIKYVKGVGIYGIPRYKDILRLVKDVRVDEDLGNIRVTMLMKSYDEYELFKQFVATQKCTITYREDANTIKRHEVLRGSPIDVTPPGVEGKVVYDVNFRIVNTEKVHVPKKKKPAHKYKKHPRNAKKKARVALEGRP
ncbi:MAG: hypothetical protein D6698_11975 [Gammaproteobacteria bacterium]|nr:MAG: hypothetical protein D6698_11975 [Gammaproteobacteria bacterium]